MTIREYRTTDFERLKEITAICFDGTSIDQNIEKRFGIIAGKDWQWRKTRHIDADVEANAAGIFVAEIDGETVGYITTRIDHEAGIGSIPNFSVLPEHQKKGIGKKLMETALEHFKSEGMEYAKIEGLDQNPIASHFYPKLGFQEVATQIHYLMPIDRA